MTYVSTNCTLETQYERARKICSTKELFLSNYFKTIINAMNFFYYTNTVPLLINFSVLPINRKQKVFPNGTLVIENVERMSDQATYTCVAKNSQSYSARGTLELQVMGKVLIDFYTSKAECLFKRL